MTNIMKRSKALKIISSAIRPALIIFAVFCGLIFMSVYFDLSSSTNMVNTDLNKYLIPICVLCFVYTIAFYKTEKGFSKKVSRIIVICSVLAFLGCIFITGVSEQTSSAFMLYGLAVIAFIALYLKYNDSLTWQNGAFLIIACGCVMIIGHGMAVPETLDLHDSSFNNSFEESNGHASYIGYIVNNWSLPDTNTPWQYYQPPLHHIFAAVFFKINQTLGLEYRRCAENINLLTGMYSCLNTIVWYKILKQFKLKKAAFLIPLSIIVLHPTAFIMGNCTSNDMLMWLFISLCILYLIKWYQTPSIKNIMVLALCLGLGMMSKISAVLLAPAIAFVLLYKFIQDFKKKTYKPLVMQYLTFGIVSIPIGMFYPIRNLIKFDQALGYVPKLTAEDQYIGDISLLERIIPLSFEKVTESPFVIWYRGGDYNLFIKLLKTSLFGESTYATEFNDGLLLQYLLTLLNYFLIVISIIAIIYVLYNLSKSTQKPILYYFLTIYYVTLIIMIINFAINYPHQCTLDIRYIAAVIPIGALFIGKMCNMIYETQKHKSTGTAKETESAKSRIKFLLPYFIAVITVVYCAVSIMIFFIDSYYRVF